MTLVTMALPAPERRAAADREDQPVRLVEAALAEEARRAVAELAALRVQEAAEVPRVRQAVEDLEAAQEVAADPAALRAGAADPAALVSA